MFPMTKSLDPSGIQRADAERNSTASIEAEDEAAAEDGDGYDGDVAASSAGSSPCLLLLLLLRNTLTDCLILILIKEVPRAICKGRGASSGISAEALRSKRRVEREAEGEEEEDAAAAAAAGASCRSCRSTSSSSSSSSPSPPTCTKKSLATQAFFAESRW